MLKRLPDGEGCTTIAYTDGTLLCVYGIVFMTDFSQMLAILDDARMRSGLYPFFRIVLLNDFTSFAL